MENFVIGFVFIFFGIPAIVFIFVALFLDLSNRSNKKRELERKLIKEKNEIQENQVFEQKKCDFKKSELHKDLFEITTKLIHQEYLTALSEIKQKKPYEYSFEQIKIRIIDSSGETSIDIFTNENKIYCINPSHYGYATIPARLLLEALYEDINHYIKNLNRKIVIIKDDTGYFGVSSIYIKFDKLPSQLIN